MMNRHQIWAVLLYWCSPVGFFQLEYIASSDCQFLTYFGIPETSLSNPEYSPTTVFGRKEIILK